MLICVYPNIKYLLRTVSNTENSTHVNGNYCYSITQRNFYFFLSLRGMRIPGVRRGINLGGQCIFVLVF